MKKVMWNFLLVIIVGVLIISCKESSSSGYLSNAVKNTLSRAGQNADDYESSIIPGRIIVQFKTDDEILLNKSEVKNYTTGDVQKIFNKYKIAHTLKSSKNLIGKKIIQKISDKHSKRLRKKKIFSHNKIESIVKKHSEKLGKLILLSVDRADRKETLEIAKKLKKHSLVKFALPDRKIRVELNDCGQDPEYYTGWNNNQISAIDAWTITNGSSNVVVAISDTGVDYTHPDLFANMWDNPGEIAGNGIDDDGNGFIDDLNGFNFGDSIDANDDGDYNDPGDVSFNDPMDDYYHGTHVAGIVAANGNINGIAPNIKILPVKVLKVEGVRNYTILANNIISFAYASMYADVINCSWQCSFENAEEYNALKSAVELAGESGVLVVAGAGNDFTDLDLPSLSGGTAFGCYDSDNLILVASTNISDELLPSSNYGYTRVHLGAPGRNVCSTMPTFITDAMTYEGYDMNYESLSGTSMAAPHVSGAAALLRSLYPDMDWMAIKTVIMKSVDPVPALDGMVVSGGRLNVYNMLIYAEDKFSNAYFDDPNTVFDVSLFQE